MNTDVLPYIAVVDDLVLHKRVLASPVGALIAHKEFKSVLYECRDSIDTRARTLLSEEFAPCDVSFGEPEANILRDHLISKIYKLFIPSMECAKARGLLTENYEISIDYHRFRNGDITDNKKVMRHLNEDMKNTWVKDILENEYCIVDLITVSIHKEGELHNA